jgi:tRNA(Ile)-lysidine synthase
MSYIVAVSGGVDSVVLLDMLVKKGEHELVVAHFDHGIRPESNADARFVEELARMYHLPFESVREELGDTSSEERARERRYTFLRSIAKKYNALIVTAHHLDDLVETVVINFERGTGWRGLAVLNAQDTNRPLLAMTKQEIYTYALENNLEWVEDETNVASTYHRNRVRKRTNVLNINEKHAIAMLRDKQIDVAKHIDQETEKIGKQWGASRYPYCMTEIPEVLEILRSITDKRLTRPQQKALWLAIKTARPGTVHESGNGITVHFSLDEFRVAMV